VNWVELAVQVGNIAWDVESEENNQEKILNSLPVQAELVLALPKGYTEEELGDEIIETLSELYGFAIYGCSYVEKRAS